MLCHIKNTKIHNYARQELIKIVFINTASSIQQSVVWPAAIEMCEQFIDGGAEGRDKTKTHNSSSCIQSEQTANVQHFKEYHF